MRVQYDCTICLEPVSMKEERADRRVWDADVEPGGWCHRWCWDAQHSPTPSQVVLAEILGDPIIRQRRRIAAQRVRDHGQLTVRRPPEAGP